MKRVTTSIRLDACTALAIANTAMVVAPWDGTSPLTVDTLETGS
jgi:hypothetical protein